MEALGSLLWLPFLYITIIIIISPGLGLAGAGWDGVGGSPFLKSLLAVLYDTIR